MPPSSSSARSSSSRIVALPSSSNAAFVECLSPPSKRKTRKTSSGDEAAQVDASLELLVAGPSTLSCLRKALHFEPADASVLESLKALLAQEEAKSDDDDDEFEGEYERRRRKRLRANQALFEQLGLGGSVHFDASASTRGPTRRSTKPWLAIDYIDPPCLQNHIKEQYQLRLDIPVLPPIEAPQDRWQVWRRIDELQARLQVLRYNNEFDYVHHRQRESSRSAYSSTSPTSSRLVVRLRIPTKSGTDYSSTRGSSKEHNVWVRSAADMSDCASEELDWIQERRRSDDDDDSQSALDSDDFASGVLEYTQETTSADASPQFAYEEQVARLSVQANSTPELAIHTASPFKEDKAVTSPFVPVSSHPWSPRNLSSSLPHHEAQRHTVHVDLALHGVDSASSSLTPSPRVITLPTVLHSSQRHSPSSASQNFHQNSYDRSAPSAALQYDLTHTLPLHSQGFHRGYHSLPDSSGTPNIDFTSEFISAD